VGRLSTVVGNNKGVSGNNGGNEDEGGNTNDGSSGDDGGNDEELNSVCLPDLIFASFEAVGLIVISAT